MEVWELIASIGLAILMICIGIAVIIFAIKTKD